MIAPDNRVKRVCVLCDMFCYNLHCDCAQLAATLDRGKWPVAVPFIDCAQLAGTLGIGKGPVAVPFYRLRTASWNT